MKNVKNNKGFSLVELIIVIAIMAVLIGILAPQYLKFVEKSRLSADNEYIDSVRKVCETILSDPSYDVPAPPADGSYTITFSDNATPASAASNVTVTLEDGTTTTLADLIDLSIDIDGSDTGEQNEDTFLNSRTYANATDNPEIVITMEDADNDNVLEPRVTVDNMID